MAATVNQPASDPAPPAARRVWTRAEVLALGDSSDWRRGPKYELVDGALLVTATPFAPHQRMVFQLGLLLHAHVQAHGLGELFILPADISFDGESLVQPDAFVVPPDQRPAKRWDVVKRMLLAVEVVSKSSERADRVEKRRHYQKHRVGEYWVVDLKARVFEVWAPDDERPAVLDRALVWRPRMDGWAPEVPPLEIDLVTLFADVLGPEAEAKR